MGLKHVQRGTGVLASVAYFNVMSQTLKVMLIVSFGNCREISFIQLRVGSFVYFAFPGPSKTWITPEEISRHSFSRDVVLA